MILNLLKKIILILYIFIILLMIKRIYVNDISKKLHGSDKYLGKFENLYCIGVIRFTHNLDIDLFWNKTKKNIIN